MEVDADGAPQTSPQQELQQHEVVHPAATATEGAAAPYATTAPPPPERKRLWHLQGQELVSACERCAHDIQEAEDFNAKFLVLDQWLRVFDGEPAPVVAAAPAKGSNGVSGSQAAGTAQDGGETKAVSADCGKRRFAKYKRLKEAMEAFEVHFCVKAFETVIPLILTLAALAAADDNYLASTVEQAVASIACPDGGGRHHAQLSALAVQVLLANALLLNVHGDRSLQLLYVSSAKAAPQKLLCLLAFFRERSDPGRVITFERLQCPEGSCPAPGQAEGAPFQVTVDYQPSLAAALHGARSAVFLLSSAGSFGKVADVKTPPEEVLLWEFPELLATGALFGSKPLVAREVCVVRHVRQVNHCVADGPMLSLSTGASSEPTQQMLLDLVAMDITRHVDDMRFAMETLKHDCQKWVAAFDALAGDAPITVCHPPLLGVDRHWAFAMQCIAASIVGAKENADPVVLRYVLAAEYTTGEETEVVAAQDEKLDQGTGVKQLSQQQSKEAKHFDALAGRMKSNGWSAGQALGLLSIFPFVRASEAERFHAFWTRRLRDKSSTGGRPSAEEIATAAQKQGELEPPPAPEPPPEPVPPPKKLPPPTKAGTATQTEGAKPSGVADGQQHVQDTDMHEASKTHRSRSPRRSPFDDRLASRRHGHDVHNRDHERQRTDHDRHYRDHDWHYRDRDRHYREHDRSYRDHDRHHYR